MSSFVLAIIMAFSCMAVIGNAALEKTQLKYDVIDDADLTPEQVADIINQPHHTYFMYWRTKNMEVNFYETIN